MGLDHNDASLNVKDEPNGTAVQSQIDNPDEVALELGLKVQKRDRQLDVAKGRITTLNEWLREAAECESILRAEVQGLRLQETNWRRTSNIVKTVLDSAEAFRA